MQKNKIILICIKTFLSNIIIKLQVFFKNFLIKNYSFTFLIKNYSFTL